MIIFIIPEKCLRLVGDQDNMGFNKWTPYIGIDETKDFKKTGPALIAEFLGTMFLVLVGCGSTLTIESEKIQPSIVSIALCFGITVATIAQSIGHISGCHINPAVTFGLFFGGKIGLINSFLYTIVQCLGGLTGAVLLKALLGSLVEKAGGAVGTNGFDKISAGQVYQTSFFGLNLFFDDFSGCWH